MANNLLAPHRLEESFLREQSGGAHCRQTAVTPESYRSEPHARQAATSFACVIAPEGRVGARLFPFWTELEPGVRDKRRVV
jgi:hypothetical protein